MIDLTGSEEGKKKIKKDVQAGDGVVMEMSIAEQQAQCGDQERWHGLGQTPYSAASLTLVTTLRARDVLFAPLLVVLNL